MTDKPHGSMFSIAQAEAEFDIGGRYKGVVKSAVTGSAPVSQVPSSPVIVGPTNGRMFLMSR
jgi:hypothetical protein